MRRVEHSPEVVGAGFQIRGAPPIGEPRATLVEQNHTPPLREGCHHLGEMRLFLLDFQIRRESGDVHQIASPFLTMYLVGDVHTITGHRVPRLGVRPVAPVPNPSHPHRHSLRSQTVCHGRRIAFPPRDPSRPAHGSPARRMIATIITREVGDEALIRHRESDA